MTVLNSPFGDMDNEPDSFSEDTSKDECRKEEVFTLENGEPIPIHLHRSLGRGGGKALADKIKVLSSVSWIPR